MLVEILVDFLDVGNKGDHALIAYKSVGMYEIANIETGLKEVVFDTWVREIHIQNKGTGLQTVKTKL